MFKTLKLVGGIALAFALILTFTTHRLNSGATAAAEAERQVDVPVARKIQPVVVTKVTLGNAVVQAGRFVKPETAPLDPVTRFQAGDDWIQNLTIYLFNRTNFTIVYANIHLGFPETGDGLGQPQRSFTLQFGRIPPAADFDQSGNALPQPPARQPMLFRSRETIAIHLGDYIDRMRASAEPTIPLATVTKLGIHLGIYYFADGMLWHGRYSMPDRQTFRWKPMDPNYFPGDMDRNWPGRPGWVDQMN